MINSINNEAIDAVRDVIPQASPTFRMMFVDWWTYEAPCRDVNVENGPDDEATDAFNEMYEATPSSAIDLALKVQACRITREGSEFPDRDIQRFIDDLRMLGDPMQDMAAAWIDRWQALGGSFSTIHDKDGLNGRTTRFLPMPYCWTPPEKHNPLLRPHEWIIEEADHSGASKMLESLLTLVPGLRQAVKEMAEAKGLVIGGRDAMRAELRQRGMCGHIPDDFVDELIQLRIFADLYGRIKDDPEKLARFRTRMADLGVDFERIAA